MKVNPRNMEEKLKLKKFDPVVRKHVLFTQDDKNLGRNVVKAKKR